ncbi:MAG: hypothetical protein HYT93_00840 [Parcubacteria group bacterium]|nr:hypothetical protein [Parcubacteria group bacterium]
MSKTNRPTILLDLKSELFEEDLFFVNWLSHLAQEIHDEFGKISLQFKKDHNFMAISAEFRWGGTPLLEAQAKRDSGREALVLFVRPSAPRDQVFGQNLKHPFKNLGAIRAKKTQTELVRQLFVGLHLVLVLDSKKLADDIAILEKTIIPAVAQ